MGIRTGKELLESLRDDRALFIDGERVADVTTDPRFAGAARSLAELYDMQHDPALVERMSFRSTTSGTRVGLSFIEPRTVDDLIRRRDMVKIWMDALLFGRPGAARRHPLRPLRQGRPHRPDFRDPRRSRGQTECRRVGVIL